VAKLNPPAAGKNLPKLVAGRPNYSINFNLMATIFSFAEGDLSFWLSSGKPKKYPVNPVK